MESVSPSTSARKYPSYGSFGFGCTPRARTVAVILISLGESPSTLTIPFTSLTSRRATFAAGHLLSKCALRSSSGTHPARSATANSEYTSRGRIGPLQEGLTIMRDECCTDNPAPRGGLPGRCRVDVHRSDPPRLDHQLHACVGGRGGAGDRDCLGCCPGAAPDRPADSRRIPRQVVRQADSGPPPPRAARRRLRIWPLGRSQPAADHSGLESARGRSGDRRACAYW